MCVYVCVCVCVCVCLFVCVCVTQLYNRLCPSVGRSVGWYVTHELKSGKTRISAPAHPSATGGRVSGLVYLFIHLFIFLVACYVTLQGALSVGRSVVWLVGHTLCFLFFDRTAPDQILW